MKPVIFGCAGVRLSDDERALFADARPVGAILFKRNIETPDQVAALVADLKSVIGKRNALILIDQEGGRVQRLGPPHWRRVPPAQFFADLETEVPGKGASALRLSVMRMGAELRALGINVDCLPVLDVPVADAHDIIGDRAYGDDPAFIAKMGRVVADALISVGVLPIMKHIPGHGRALADSHEDLPVVDTDQETLSATDFAPFRALADLPMAMTAHVVYSAIDEVNPATLSSKVLSQVVRQQIGFKGLLVSDDLCMNALGGELGGAVVDRATAALAAGIDLALHCDGNLVDMQAIAVALPEMTEDEEARVRDVMEMIEDVPIADIAALTREFDALMASEEE